MPFKHGIFFQNFHSICTVRSCKPRRGAFNKGGSQTDDRQILLLDLGYKFHGDSLCSGACFEPAWTLWFCWSHLCQMWVWKVWASRILDHCPSRPFLGCSFGASVLPSPSNVLLKRRLLNMTAARLCGKAAFTCTCVTCFTCINCWESRMKLFRGCTSDWNITITKGRRHFSYVHFLQLHYWRSVLTMMTLDLVVWNTTEASEVFIVPVIGKRDSLWPEQRNNGMHAQSCDL